MTVDTMLRMLSAAAVPAITSERRIRLDRIGLSFALDAPPVHRGLRTGTVSPINPLDNDPTVPDGALVAVRSAKTWSSEACQGV